jgi:hypothetical protein
MSSSNSFFIYVSKEAALLSCCPASGKRQNVFHTYSDMPNSTVKSAAVTVKTSHIL